VKCLKDMVRQRQDKTKPVLVRIMSDRTCTVTRLAAFLKRNNHTVSVFQHADASPDEAPEHGPYAGIGYFQDLALVSSAQSGLIAMRRSSSDLLRELMVFNKYMLVWETGDDTKSRMVDECVLPVIPRPEDFKRVASLAVL
jgi:hypothetical protein